MKTNCWLILGTMLATSVIAQNNNTNALPEIPPPATTPAAEAQPTLPAAAPAAEKPKPAKKRAPVKKIKEPTVTLVPGPAEVAAPQVNVRGQAGLKGEAIAHLKQGEAIN